MADLSHKRAENLPGFFYVDDSCIDCDTCRWMAPELFNRMNSGAVVYHQPDSEYEREKGMQALLSCPTGSIGVTEETDLFDKVKEGFPLPIEEDVYYCGFSSEKTYGAASYFIQRDGGNILIDSPRFSSFLAKKLEAMGGVKYFYFTHKDPIAEHQKYHDYFGAERVIHEGDLIEETQDFEHILQGQEPIQFADDIMIIPSPGHTKGSAVLLYKNKFLFTGDHLAFSATNNQLIGFADFCWHSWEEQQKSMNKLRDFTFEWVLPGHGRRLHASVEQMSQELEKCISWMQKVS